LVAGEHPIGRAAAASWTVNDVDGMIFSGQFDLCIAPSSALPIAQPRGVIQAPESDFEGFYIPPNSLHLYNGSVWNLLGGMDTWTGMSVADMATALANGYMQGYHIKEIVGREHPAMNEWPLPRSHAQTFVQGGLSYMFSGRLQMVMSRSNQFHTNDLLLNDFWVFNPNAEYDVDRTLVAQRIAQCASVVDRPEITPRDPAQGSYSYPGPRQDAATWSTAVDSTVQSARLKVHWVDEAWMFGGIGVATSQSVSQSSCLSDKATELQHLCDLWVFVRRDGWKLAYSCDQTKQALYRAGMFDDLTSSFSGRGYDVLAHALYVQHEGPHASIFSTTWTEVEWEQREDGSLHAETSLWMFGGVTDCPARTDQLASSENDTVCNLLWTPRATTAPGVTPASCSADLWRFTTRTQEWARVSPVPDSDSISISSSVTSSLTGTTSTTSTTSSAQRPWPTPRCGALHVGGSIPSWHTRTGGPSDPGTFSLDADMRFPPPMVEQYNQEMHHAHGHSSILLGGGWSGAPNGQCESTLGEGEGVIGMAVRAAPPGQEFVGLMPVIGPIDSDVVQQPHDVIDDIARDFAGAWRDSAGHDEDKAMCNDATGSLWRWDAGSVDIVAQ
jgi:hypothetical protein